MSHQLSLSLSLSTAPTVGYSLLVSAFSLPISITIPELTILEFILWTMN
jgi:hypothetical protein